MSNKTLEQTFFGSVGDSIENGGMLVRGASDGSIQTMDRRSSYGSSPSSAASSGPMGGGGGGGVEDFQPISETNGGIQNSLSSSNLLHMIQEEQSEPPQVGGSQMPEKMPHLKDKETGLCEICHKIYRNIDSHIMLILTVPKLKQLTL